MNTVTITVSPDADGFFSVSLWDAASDDFYVQRGKAVGPKFAGSAMGATMLAFEAFAEIFKDRRIARFEDLAVDPITEQDFPGSASFMVKTY